MDGTSLYCGRKRVKLFRAATLAKIIAEHGKIITFSVAHCLACHVHAVRLQLQIGIICICKTARADSSWSDKVSNDGRRVTPLS